MKTKRHNILIIASMAMCIYPAIYTQAIQTIATNTEVHETSTNTQHHRTTAITPLETLSSATVGIATAWSTLYMLQKKWPETFVESQALGLFVAALVGALSINIYGHVVLGFEPPFR